MSLAAWSLFWLLLSPLATWCEELTHLKKPWYWEKWKAGGEGDNRGWDGWMASPTQWTWVWVNSGTWQWTGRPAVHGVTKSRTRLSDWTELILVVTSGPTSVMMSPSSCLALQRMVPTGALSAADTSILTSALVALVSAERSGPFHEQHLLGFLALYGVSL